MSFFFGVFFWTALHSWAFFFLFDYFFVTVIGGGEGGGEVESGVKD